MINSAAIRVRWETFGSKLDERGDAPGLTVLRLNLGQEVAQRRVVGGVAGEPFIGEGQAFRRRDQGDDDLDAVGAPVAAVAEAGQNRRIAKIPLQSS